MYPVEEHSNRMEFYPHAGKEIPKYLPPEKGSKVRMTVYVDADHTHDLVTRRSITGILVITNNTPIRWISKRYKTVDISTYGSNWWLQELIRNLFLILGICFGHGSVT
jgi:hypothetical protein